MNNRDNSYQDILARAKRVKLLIMDVDGVLTDGRIYYGANGEIGKAFNVRDGLGIKRLLRLGIAVAVISGRDSAATRARLAELGVEHIYMAIKDKAACYNSLKEQLGVQDEEVAYIGDDLPDLEMLKLVGLGVAPADATEVAVAAARYITKNGGGYGAVRDLCDLIEQAHA